MTAAILDEFTALNVSRERKRQLRRRAAGYCARAGCRARKGRGAFCVVCAGVESKRVATRAKARRQEAVAVNVADNQSKGEQDHER